MKSYTTEDQESHKTKQQIDNLTRSNQFYVAQVSQMEVKISELKALIQAKDSEIEYLKKKLESSEDKADEYLKSSQDISNKALMDLQNRNSMLEEENSIYKNQLNLTEDISNIKIQFEHALRMKEIFEEKYREIKSMMIKSEMNLGQEPNEKSDSYKIILQEKETSLRKEFEDLIKKLFADKEFYKKKFEESDKINANLKYEYEKAVEKIRDLENNVASERVYTSPSPVSSDIQSRSFRSLMSKTSENNIETEFTPNKTFHSSSSHSNLISYQTSPKPEANIAKPPLGNKKPELKIISIIRESETKEIQPLDTMMTRSLKANSLIRSPISKLNDEAETPSNSLRKSSSTDFKSNQSNRSNSTQILYKKAEYCPTTMRTAKASNSKNVFIDLDQNEKIS